MQQHTYLLLVGYLIYCCVVLLDFISSHLLFPLPYVVRNSPLERLLPLCTFFSWPPTTAFPGLSSLRCILYSLRFQVQCLGFVILVGYCLLHDKLTYLRVNIYDYHIPSTLYFYGRQFYTGQGMVRLFPFPLFHPFGDIPCQRSSAIFP